MKGKKMSNLYFKLVNSNMATVKEFNSFEEAHNFNTKICYGCHALYVMHDQEFGKKLYENAMFEKVS